MENLTKENFWNEQQEKYPAAMKVFCDWIDEYKKKNNWNELFNSNSDYQDSNGKNAPAPKYHDLPYAMQIGIWIEFATEQCRFISWTIELVGFDWRQGITNDIMRLDSRLKGPQ